jgi:hypothetical protein
MLVDGTCSSNQRRPVLWDVVGNREIPVGDEGFQSASRNFG